MLNNSLIMIISVVALFSAIFARIYTEKSIAAPLYVGSFLCAVFCVTYAFLLGIEIEHILTYILVFTLLTATVFQTSGGQAVLPQRVVCEGIKQ